MSDLLAARSQMAISLGFHIIFAAIGVAMPFLMAAAHWKWLKTGKPVYRDLTQAWSKGVAILFATGAVSGTVLSFELGLLWPKFMENAGAIIGMPFSWEGTAFFLEAIAIGIFLYGWNRVSPWVHWTSGLVVGISGVLSALFVICANGWMNSPAGFEWVQGHPVKIDPWAAMFNQAALGQGIHMVIAAFEATAIAVTGIHAMGLLKAPHSAFHREAFKIGLTFAAFAALIQPLDGDRLAKSVAVRQPVKLAAMEALFETSQPAPFLLGGIPHQDSRTVSYGLHIPKVLSFLAHGDFNSKVLGLDSVPSDQWPPVAITHFAFQLMIGLGTLLAIFSIFSFYFLVRKPEAIFKRSFLRIAALCTPLGFVAIEAGWAVTEVGRQPWIIYGIMRTSDAVTPMKGVVYPMTLFTLLYLFLSFMIIWLLRRQFKHVTS